MRRGISESVLSATTGNSCLCLIVRRKIVSNCVCVCVFLFTSAYVCMCIFAYGCTRRCVVYINTFLYVCVTEYICIYVYTHVYDEPMPSLVPRLGYISPERQPSSPGSWNSSACLQHEGHLLLLQSLSDASRSGYRDLDPPNPCSPFGSPERRRVFSLNSSFLSVCRLGCISE